MEVKLRGMISGIISVTVCSALDSNHQVVILTSGSDSPHKLLERTTMSISFCMLKLSQWFWKIRARIQDEIGEHRELKECSIGSPLKYLGGLLQEVNLANGMRAWAFGSIQYVQAAVKNLGDNLHKQGEKLLLWHQCHCLANIGQKLISCRSVEKRMCLIITL